MSRLNFSRQYLTYTAGLLMQKVAAFVLIPLYTAVLTTGDYGTLELLSNFVGLAALVAVLGVPSAMNKCYHRDCANESERSELLGTTILFTLPAALAIVVVAFTFDRALATAMFARPEWAFYVRLALIMLALMQTSLIPMELMRTLGRAGQYVAFSLLQMLVQIGISVLLLLQFRLGVTAVLLGNIAGYAVVQLVSLPMLWRHATFTLSPRHLRHLAAFGLLLVPISACGWIVNVSDRFFLQRLASDAEVGLYALGYKFGMLVELVLVLPFQKAWNPYYFRIADSPEAPRVFGRVLTYYILLLCLGVGLMSACGASALRLLAHPDFYRAGGVIPLIASSYGLSGLVMCLSTALIVSARTRFVAAIAVTGAAVNTVLNITLIPGSGMMGAAISTLATFATTGLLTVWAVARWYPIPLEKMRLAKVGLSAAALTGAAFLVNASGPEIEILARASILLSLPLVLFAVGFFSDEEVESMKAVVLRLGTRGTVSGAS